MSPCPFLSRMRAGGDDTRSSNFPQASPIHERSSRARVTTLGLTRKIYIELIFGEDCESHGAASFGLTVLSGSATSTHPLIIDRIAHWVVLDRLESVCISSICADNDNAVDLALRHLFVDCV